MKGLPQSLLILLIFLNACSITKKMERGKVSPKEFHEILSIDTYKGIVVIPCEYEGEIKNYCFDTGAQLSGVQREKIKGRKVKVRGATNRVVENGTEVMRSFKIAGVDFRNTFSTNSDFKGLKEQIPDFGGIIGRPIIDRANWLIDLPNKKLEISSENLANEEFKSIPLDPDYESPYTSIRIENEDYKAILDMGSTSELNIPEDLALADSLMKWYQFHDHTRKRYTVGGLQNITEKVDTIPYVSINDIKFENVRVTINKSSQLRIGINLFKDHVLYIDNTNNQYMLKKSSPKP